MAGRVAVITGAASGIGAAIAARLIAAGARVISVDLAQTVPDPLKGQIAAHFQADISDEPRMQAVAAEIAQRFGQVDIWINNAGIGDTGPDITQSDRTTFQKLVDVNVMGVFLGLKHGAPLVRDGGVILNTASLASQVCLPGFAQYSATKSAVASLTRSAATELGPRGIRVNAISPGTHRTPMMPTDDPEYDLALNATTLNTIGDVADLAGVYHFLASDEARYISGQEINVDGGWSAGISATALDRLT